jgi:Ni,Fe-hydrogenase III small subunit
LVTDPVWGTVAPQVFVNSPAGTTQITNLTIDGTGEVGAVPCAYTDPVHPPSPVRQTTGIYSYSSVKTNEVTTIGQGQNNGCGVGILAEASPANDSVTITHSLVENPSYTGIILDGEVAGSMTVSLTHNTVVFQDPIYPAGAPQAALQSSAISGEISSNTFSTYIPGSPTGGIPPRHSVSR